MQFALLTIRHKRVINNVLESFQNENLINKNVAGGLRTTSPKFYIQGKIHKQSNPARPVISSVNCYTSDISKCVDYHFQPIVQQISSYIQHKSDFLRKINTIETIPDNSYLVSLNVRCLYTSIPNSEDIKAVKISLDKFLRRAVSTKVITIFRSLILMLKNFVLNCKNYLQIKG